MVVLASQIWNKDDTYCLTFKALVLKVEKMKQVMIMRIRRVTLLIDFWFCFSMLTLLHRLSVYLITAFVFECTVLST